MAKDFAKKSRASAGHRKNPTKSASPRKKTPARATVASRSGSGWRWYSAGIFTGVFLSFLVYLGTLPPSGLDAGSQAQTAQVEEKQPPKPRFDFYKMLPEQSMEVEVEPAEVARPRAEQQTSERYLLQAGSFRQREDADARRAQLLLLGLDPRVEEADGDNGRWFRVYLGPFDSKSSMARARSLTAAQGIDTLLRNAPVPQPLIPVATAVPHRPRRLDPAPAPQSA